MGSGTDSDTTHCDGSDVLEQLNAVFKFDLMH
jgi:hypothetical protein